jgi:thiamine-monophosphate kinase
VSDGLARDARRIAEASGVGIDFRSGALGADPLTALAGAEDHGLLAAFPADVAPPHPFEVVGVANADAGVLTLDGEPVDTSGWDPYAGWDGATG